MKKFSQFILPLFLFVALIVSAATVSVVMTGCNTSQQSFAYKTIYSIERATVAGYDGYVRLVISGDVPTNDFPVVSKRFNQFQASALVALNLVEFNTNALAPTSLVIESGDLLNLIEQIKRR